MNNADLKETITSLAGALLAIEGAPDQAENIASMALGLNAPIIDAISQEVAAKRGEA